MDRNSGVFPSTPYDQKNYYGRFDTGQDDSAIYGQRRVSSCRSENTRMVKVGKKTDCQDKDDSHDPEYWIKKNILSLLDDGGEGLSPELAGHSTDLSKGNSLRNDEVSVVKAADLSQSFAMEVFQENQKMERLFSVTQEATCTGSLSLEDPYSQPGKNGFTKFWNQ